jgi:hypothetical protein
MSSCVGSQTRLRPSVSNLCFWALRFVVLAQDRRRIGVACPALQVLAISSGLDDSLP